MPVPPLYPRLVAPRLTEALADSPVVLIHGPRQCGKTTLAQVVGERLGHTYFSLDDGTTRAAAESDPVGFVGRLRSPVSRQSARPVRPLDAVRESTVPPLPHAVCPLA